MPLPGITIGPYHQVLGPEGGCVFPSSVPTLGNQLSAARLMPQVKSFGADVFTR